VRQRAVVHGATAGGDGGRQRAAGAWRPVPAGSGDEWPVMGRQAAAVTSGGGRRWQAVEGGGGGRGWQ
jgi:hypothetical protein